MAPGRELTSLELVAYDLIDTDLAEEVRVYRVPKPPGPFVGITLGRHVFLAVDVLPNGTSKLMAHELVHVEQWRRHGPVGFLSRYLRDYVRGILRTRSLLDAYRAIELEFEARQRADEWLRARS